MEVSLISIFVNNKVEKVYISKDLTEDEFMKSIVSSLQLDPNEKYELFERDSSKKYSYHDILNHLEDLKNTVFELRTNCIHRFLFLVRFIHSFKTSFP